MAKKIDAADAMPLLARFAAGETLTHPQTLIAVRFSLQDFAERHPGRSVEIRVPWVGAVQAIAGPVHTRGTPPNVVELDAHTWLALATGQPTNGIIQASGTRADISEYLPLYGRSILRKA